MSIFTSCYSGKPAGPASAAFQYKLLCLLVVFFALCMSLSEVIVLSSIKPFIQSFSSLSKNSLASLDINPNELILKEAYRFLSTIIVCGILRVFLISFQYRTAAVISSSISSKAFKKIYADNIASVIVSSTALSFITIPIVVLIALKFFS